MRRDEVGARVREKVAEAAGLPVERIEAQMSLISELALDSLRLFELAGELEDEFHLPDSGDDDLAGIETVEDIERRVLELLAAREGEDACAS